MKVEVNLSRAMDGTKSSAEKENKENGGRIWLKYIICLYGTAFIKPSTMNNEYTPRMKIIHEHSSCLHSKYKTQYMTQYK